MDWLKGIMGPSAQFPGQGPPGIGGVPGSALGGLAGMAAPLAGAALGSPLGNPLGGMMGGTPSFGAPGADPYGGMGGPPIGGAPPIGGGMAPGGYVPPGDAFASNAGYGGGMPPMGPPPGNPYASAPGMAGGTGREAALEAEVASLRHDVEALALFSRTLLTVMLERKILTVDEFQQTKNKIDMLDGKLDDRVAKGT